ncbi:lytic murein transglycosylase [Solirubrobacter ginsenosidimutans]|uniref:Lytic murein transglycosylase n=1 Tax=Solirubrobacter ginsenosidimutans TaxID=490573 RepID=A0A9X3MSN1_9ACTN|nr:lytic murein transglycosylase [Solirubrobacter ginsenosidimutans]MDA0160445.1 lytic murein transglycosylase [Solirubrobacter ginsenosidimutans]
MRVPIIVLIAVCTGMWSGRADAQEPAATVTVTATPTATTPEPTPTATAAATEAATPAQVPAEPVPAAPAAEETAAPTAVPAASAAPAATLPSAVTTPRADRAPTPARRPAHAPNTERRTGSVEPHTTATPGATTTPHTPMIAPATLGPVAVAVPNFFIDRFRIPPFLLPIYQAAGTQYGIRWEILAAINEIETDYGRNLNVSSAGAVGWMQFMPATWKQYGVDANRDGVKDPFNPVDAIFASARYLRAAGAARDLRRAIFAYNHADWYVDSVLMRARVVGGLPQGLVSSLTGLTQGVFPVRGRTTYGGRRTRATRRGIDVYAGAGTPVIAAADGRVSKLGQNSVRLRDVFGNTYTYAHFEPRRLRVGSQVIAGTELGRIGGRTPHLRFEIRPAGRGAPRIDPKPILDGWKLLESSARGTLLPRDAGPASIGEVILMSKDALARRVLADRRIHIYACGRHDIQTGQIDRRVLATLAFLAASGLEPTVSSLVCGHGYLTSSGNVSEHVSGNAVDIAAINGIPVLGHQGDGSVTDVTVRRLLTLQGVLKPHQIISLMTVDGTDNTFAMADHDDHIHVGFRPGAQRGPAEFPTALEPEQWTKLLRRLSAMDNPTVAATPSKYALEVNARDGH